jgi:prolyl-tRNA synthetase
MYLSQYLYKSKKDVKENLPKSLNRLIRGCFLCQESTGIVSMLPLGLKVLKKIINVVESEMNNIALQLELPIIQSTNLWKKSGRYDAYGKEMLRLHDRNNQEFILPPTCEELMCDIFTKIYTSYRDLPKILYQISWKFRDELRPKGGLLRGRLFLMKDAYSFAKTEAESHQQYIDHFNVYVKIFQKLELEIYAIQADSGEIGGTLSHEFVMISEEGEEAYLHKRITIADSIMYIKNISGVFSESIIDPDKIYEKHSVLEVGHIFYYDTKYSQKMDHCYTNSEGKLMSYYGGCYGMGITRLMGILSTKTYWPLIIAPFQIHILNIINYEQEAIHVYNILKAKNIDILYDDRKLSWGEKKQDMILIGIPLRIIISKKIEFYVYEEEYFFDSIEEFFHFFFPFFHDLNHGN